MSAHGHVDMGHTVAGWTGTATAVVGCTVLGVAVAAVSLPVALAGTGLTLGAALLTWLLHLAGWGKPSARARRASGPGRYGTARPAGATPAAWAAAWRAGGGTPPKRHRTPYRLPLL